VVGTKSVNLPTNATIKTIQLITKIKKRGIWCISANFKNTINVIETNMPMTAPNPAFIPSKLRIKDNASSVVTGTVNSVIEILAGSANFSTLVTAFIEKSVSKIIEAVLACLLRLGKRERIPFPIIAPCSKPTRITTENVIRKFFSANSSKSKVYSSTRYEIKNVFRNKCLN
tara:strand:+ start:2169 stop:2684 length:516 start_codon:yes stop_codon:yes gene_type:complete